STLFSIEKRHSEKEQKYGLLGDGSAIVISHSGIMSNKSINFLRGKGIPMSLVLGIGFAAGMRVLNWTKKLIVAQRGH
ncbi:hypothetical protein ADUPG1_005775, partial [Aduncisulcus paluster]